MIKMGKEDIIKQYTVISTFAGGGGSSLGYQMAGFKELLAIEWDNNACEILRLNFPDLLVWEKDITKIKVNDILKTLNIKKGELDILDGSPPCQGFSTAGKREINDDRNQLFKSYCYLLKGLQPKVFVMENVSGMIKGKMKGTFIEILDSLQKCGYNVKVKLMNAKYYNVPQSRERLIFIGVRKDLKVESCFPSPNKKLITCKEALKDLENKDILEINHKRHYREKSSKSVIMWEKVKHGEPVLGLSLYKINPRKPSNTIKKSSELFHYKENRILTIRECARLCSFPDNYKITWKQAGNAVMPNMMKAIAENIKVNILDKF